MRQFAQMLAASIVLTIAFAPVFSQEPDAGAPTIRQTRISPRSGDAAISLSADWLFGSDEKVAPTREKANLETCAKIDDWAVMKRPTSVQNALFQAGKLPNPYRNANADSYKSTTRFNWYFKKTFRVPKEREGQYAFLSFDGLDYFGRVWLNGVSLGWSEGMFGGPEFEISRALRYGEENELIVAVVAADRDMPNYDARDPKTRIKPWGTGGGGVNPFLAFGLWRGIRLDFAPKTHLERPFVVTKRLEEKRAVLEIETEIFSNCHSFEFGRAKGSNGAPESRVVRVELARGGKTAFSQDFPVVLDRGKNWLKKEIVVDDPALWQPNGLGEAALYDATFSLLDGERVVDSIAFAIGIRTIEWERSAGPRAKERWDDWQCVVNGRKIFLKGVDWMLIDALYDLPREKYDWYLQLAHDAGVQIVRVWGPGLQETDEFYDACDRLGIMVWQDFPIGNFSAAQWDRAVARSQFLHSIFRLRNRASLAVWCGGNEFDPYEPGNASVVDLMADCLRTYDPSRKFNRASPDMGSEHVYPDMDPTRYKKLFADVLFLAETGIHVVSSPELFEEFVDSSEFPNVGKMGDANFRELCPDTVRHIAEYQPDRVPRMTSRISHVVDAPNASVEDFSIGSQISAGEFYQIASESYQSLYPSAVGLMPWVFSRMYPVVAGIQTVDATGRPLVPYYALKRTYEPLRAALDLERVLWRSGETFPVGVVLFHLTSGPAFQGTVEVVLYDANLREVYRQSGEIEVDASPALGRRSFEPFAIPETAKSAIFFATVELKDPAGKLISRSVYYPRTVPQMEDDDFYRKQLAGPQPWPVLKNGPFLKETIAAAPKTALRSDAKRIDSHENDGLPFVDYEIEIANVGENPSVLTWIGVSAPGVRFVCDDDYFWLAPGERKTVRVRCRKDADADVGALENEIKAFSWNGD